MEKAFYNGELVDAFEISKDYALECSIRDASIAGELKCTDKDCDSPVLKYCHGDKNAAYFAHRDKSDNCEYLKYYEQMPVDLKEARRVLYETLKEKGYSVDIDVKLLNHHYSPIVVNLADEIICIELVTKQTYVQKVENILSVYENSNLKHIVVIVGKDLASQQEADMNYIERYLLNESTNNDFVIFDYEESQAIQCRFDTKEYFYNNRAVYLESSDTYQEIGDASSLIFENGSITLDGFNERFNEYLISRADEFNQKINQIKKIEEHMAFIEERDVVQSSSSINTATNKCDRNETAVISEPIIQTQKVESTINNPVEIKDLNFIEEIELTPKSKNVEVLDWDEAELKKKIDDICYKKDRVAYRLLMIKIKYGKAEEREIIRNFYIQAQKDGRKDYRYIIKTASKVYLDK